MVGNESAGTGRLRGRAWLLAGAGGALAIGGVALGSLGAGAESTTTTTGSTTSTSSATSSTTSAPAAPTTTPASPSAGHESKHLASLYPSCTRISGTQRSLDWFASLDGVTTGTSVQIDSPGAGFDQISDWSFSGATGIGESAAIPVVSITRPADQDSPLVFAAAMSNAAIPRVVITTPVCRAGTTAAARTITLTNALIQSYQQQSNSSSADHVTEEITIRATGMVITSTPIGQTGAWLPTVTSATP